MMTCAVCNRFSKTLLNPCLLARIYIYGSIKCSTPAQARNFGKSWSLTEVRVNQQNWIIITTKTLKNPSKSQWEDACQISVGNKGGWDRDPEIIQVLKQDYTDFFSFLIDLQLCWNDQKIFLIVQNEKKHIIYGEPKLLPLTSECYSPFIKNWTLAVQTLRDL